MSDRFEAVWSVANDWQRVTLVALLVATFAQTLFILVYGTRPWWRARVGQALFLKSAALCIVLWLTVIGAFYTYRHQDEVGAFGMCLVAAGIVYQLAALLMSPRNPNA